MNKLLFDKPPLVIFPELAEAIGLNEAIILQQVNYWVFENSEKKKNFRDGYYWSYNTFGKWQEQFPFWSVSTIKRAIKSLEKSGLLISSNFNKIKQDRTKWYRVNLDHDTMQSVNLTQCKVSDRHNGKGQNDTTVTRDYPEINQREKGSLLLVDHFLKKTRKELIDGEKSRYLAQAVEVLESISLEEAIACIDWLVMQEWWQKHEWGIEALRGAGLRQFRKWRSRRPRMPGRGRSGNDMIVEVAGSMNRRERRSK